MTSVAIVPGLDGLAQHMLRVDTLLIVASWVFAIGGAIVTFRRGSHPHPLTPRGFLRYCLPGDVLRSRSVRTDVIFVTIGRLARPILVGPLLMGGAVIAAWVFASLSGMWPRTDTHALGWPVYLALLLPVLLIQDFFNFFVHYLLHRVPALWELHKVHHSAEFLIPLTNRRVHPWQEVLEDLPPAIAVGVLLGLSAWALRLPIADVATIGLDAYYAANVVTFYHLRHSHVPMAFGRLEFLLVSPAQHQLHHSVDPRHYGANLGGVLACWDRIFGTWRPAEPGTLLRFGLGPEEQGQYRSMAQLYLGGPWRMLRQFPRDVAALRRPRLSAPAE